MLPFINSPDNHRAWIIEASTRSMLGEHVHKIERLCGKRLVMSNHKAVKRYNKIVKEQSDIHNIKERLDALDKLTRIYGREEPKWLGSMIIKLYKQMDEIRIHAENKCLKVMTPVSHFSPQVQHWYNIIHAYLALLRLKKFDKKYSNPSNTYRFARNCNIENPRKLTKEELRDSLRYCKIRRAEVRKSSKGLMKVLL